MRGLCSFAYGLSVYWGSIPPANGQTNWTKYYNIVPVASDTTSSSGRIAVGTSGQGDATNVYYFAMIKDDNLYKIWYAGELVVNVGRGYYATSPDGLTWTKYNNNIHAPSDTTSTDGRIPLGSAGGDAQHAYAPRVVRVGNEYKMWYTGRAFEVHRLYHATCPAPPYLPGGTAIKIY